MKPLIKQINELNQQLNSNGKKKKKKKPRPFKLPMKAKVGRSRLSKGYVIVQLIDDNKNIDFKKFPIVNGTYKIGDTYHTLHEDDLFIYKNKPFVIQPKRKINPYNPLRGEHQTYGQKYVMARMMLDTIQGDKKKMGWSAIIIILLLIGGAVWYFMKNGGV